MDSQKLMSKRLWGTPPKSYASPVRHPKPPPTSTNGMLFRVCELPFPSSFVQTIVVLSSNVPCPPGSGIESSFLAKYAPGASQAETDGTDERNKDGHDRQAG